MTRWASAALVRPYTALALSFLAWKTLLFLAALGVVGPGYDTSTALARGGRSLWMSATATRGVADVVEDDHHHHDVGPAGWYAPRDLAYNLIRWDAIYFDAIARRGYLLEQEWAFGWGHTQLLALVATGLRKLVGAWASSPWLEMNVGVVLAHVWHFLSVIVLYRLTESVFALPPSSWLSFTAASLHIISPAGIFLSAPYAESLFSFLSFAGLLLYTNALSFGKSHHSLRDLQFILAGIAFGLATSVRGNGLLYGLMFLYDVVTSLPNFLQGRVSFLDLRRLTFLVLGGTCIAMGTIVPQAIAYREYCMAPNDVAQTRPWCNRLIPSIFTWVQSHYWGVGFLGYWTLSNVPLFLLAAPMLSILVYSTMTVFDSKIDAELQSLYAPDASKSTPAQLKIQHAKAYLRRLALPQIALAVLALTTYHVQIINRISSGYALWYWWLTLSLKTDNAGKRRLSETIVRGMTMYAAVQGVLFAGFLPPA